MSGSTSSIPLLPRHEPSTSEDLEGAYNGSPDRIVIQAPISPRTPSLDETAASSTHLPPSSVKNSYASADGAPTSAETLCMAWGWGPESIALAASTASLTALVILLAHQDGQLLSTWSLPLSLNTVVSILTVAIKTPLAFVVGSCLSQGKWAWFSKRQGPLYAFVAIEEAGRGPLGSLELIWKLKLRHWVSFGAVITLALLAVDPFLQGILLYQGDTSTFSNGDAFIMRSSNLDIGTWSLENGLVLPYHERNGILKCYSFYPDIGMLLETQMGFVDASIVRLSEPPGSVCPTGNCTWPAFSTIGICSSCADITPHMTEDRGVGMDDRCPKSFTTFSNYTELKLPYGQSKEPLVMYGEEGYSYDTTSCSRERGAQTEVAVSFRPNETYSFQHWDTLLASFAVIHAPREYWDGRIPWQEASVQATECALRYCVQAFQPTMVGGKMSEAEIPVSFERVPESWGPDNNPGRKFLRLMDADFGGSLAPWGICSTTRSGPERRVFVRHAIVPRKDLQLRLLESDVRLPNDTQRVFNITQRSIATMMESMDDRMVDSVSRALSNLTNVTASFQNAARLMSYRMREIDTSRVKGDAHQWVVYIRVRWGLIAAPVAMTLAVVVFAARVVAESRRMRLEPLKSDPLEMLLHGFDHDSRDYLRENRKNGQGIDNEMVGLAKGTEGMELRLKAN